MKILHTDSSILEGNSVSRILTAAIVQALVSEHPDSKVTYRDLAASPVSHLDGAIAAGFRQPDLNAENPRIRLEHAISEELVQELLRQDVIVLGAPMYNFSVPTQLKAWLDRLAQQGRTFRYTENGPIGLVNGKSVIVASTRGGQYSSDATIAMDFQEAYLTAFFAFIGITKVSFVRAEFLTMGPELRAQSIQNALNSIPAVVADIAA